MSDDDMDLDYDSDVTEIIASDLEEEDELVEEDPEGSQTPSIHELEGVEEEREGSRTPSTIHNVEVIQEGRRRRRTVTIDDRMAIEEDSEGSRTPSIHELGAAEEGSEGSWAPSTNELEAAEEETEGTLTTSFYGSETTEEESEGSRTSRIHERDYRGRDAGTISTQPTSSSSSSSQQQVASENLLDIRSPEIRRRRRSALVLQDLPEETEQVEIAQPEVATAPPPPPAGAESPQHPHEEPQHTPLSPQIFDDLQPSPAPIPPAPPDTSHPQQPPTGPLSNDDSRAQTSATSSESPNVPAVEVSVPHPPEGPNSLAVAGPSTSATASTIAQDSRRKDTAAADASSDGEEEGHVCPICFEPCTNMGNHRIASLKCGHLFGFECINTWLQGTNKRQKGRCPHCNATSLKKDIRVLYAKTIKVLDTAEKVRMLKELEQEREEKQRLKLENAQIMLREEMKSKMVSKLQEELKVLKASVKARGNAETSSIKDKNIHSSKRLVYKEWLDVCREGNCRVMAYNEWLGILVVSMPTQVDLFPGYGIKKISLLELQVGRYLPLHQKQIRDLAFNPVKHDLLLSVGMDRLVKVTNICSNASVFQFTTSTPLWCCCWSTTDVNLFFVGTSTGRLLRFDSRHTMGPTATIELPGSGPAVSMTYIHPGPASSLTWGGLLMARLQSCLFVETGISGEARNFLLPLEGSFTSVSCDASTGHVLVSCRPSQKHPHARHAVCYLQEVRQTVTAHSVHTFQGGTTQKVLTRSLMASAPHTDLSPLVYASDESTQSIYVWEIKNMTCLQQLEVPNTVIDLLQVTVGNTPHLAALTEKGVRLYQWVN